jgi:hypothetical protein
MVAFTNPAMQWHTASVILQLLQSVYLFGLTSYLPNLIGLVMLDRWISAQPDRAAVLHRGGWLVLGVGYGLAILAAGIGVGLIFIGVPVLAFTPKAVWPGLVETLFRIKEFYLVAVIAGIVSVGGLMVQTRPNRRSHVG